MSLGTYGSTLLSELNRLANGGTYPPVNTLDEAAAARAWAADQGVLLTASDTVGVLNEIAGLPRESWLDYSGVCNYIAGTTNLPAAAALRQITGSPPSPYPSQPLNVFATAGPGEATITFSPPALSGDSPINLYMVEDSLGQSGQMGQGSPLVVPNLSPNVQYTFRVRAFNEQGAGPWSAWSNAVTPFLIPAIVSGGALTSDDTYYYRTFAYSDYLDISGTPLDAEVLLVAGGGGAGGGTYGAGGGAGGVRKIDAFGLFGSNLVQVGAGGASGGGGGYSSYYGQNGSNSVFNYQSSTGGGAAGTGFYTASGQNGGSGGGASWSFNPYSPGAGNAGAYGPPEGYNGGSGYNAGGGGGGAGGDGGYGNQAGGGGGWGTSDYSHWLAVTGYGEYYSPYDLTYIGGGGGGYSYIGGGASGGLGGGADTGESGAANTGGGGSGGGTSNGGSGLVIIRYLKSAVA